jgi:hypothetical protein
MAQPTPMFVLDRNRLASYVDSTTQFDNRHLARLPSSANLKALGIKYVLYICPTASSIGELDDLNELLVSYRSEGITVRALGANAFLAVTVPTATTTTTTQGGSGATGTAKAGAPSFKYGGSAEKSEAFWSDYPWSDGPVSAGASSGVAPAGRTFVPVLRKTPFSSSVAGGSATPTPAGFATVPVALAVSTGILLGAQWSRSGSWNRSSSGSSGSWGGG